jgi:glutathione transport system permease protein
MDSEALQQSAVDPDPMPVIDAALVPDATSVRTPWSEFWRKFRKQHVAVAAGLFVLLLVLIAVIAPLIVPYDAENFFDYDSLNALPSLKHWFGVDPLGRDIFSRILMGARISLTAGFVSVAVGALIGTGLGLVAGYYEGWWDRVIMRLCDVLFAFPGILLAIGIVAILGGGMANVIIAVSIFSIPTFARLVRGNTLSLKHLTFIEAARSIGASDWTIVIRHIFPGTIAAVVVYFSLRIGTSIITAASLSFIGMGAQPPTPEWGAMLNEARADMMTSPHVAIFPSLAIFLTVHAVNLRGDGRRDALAPKIYQKCPRRSGVPGGCTRRRSYRWPNQPHSRNQHAERHQETGPAKQDQLGANSRNAKTGRWNDDRRDPGTIQRDLVAILAPVAVSEARGHFDIKGLHVLEGPMAPPAIDILR